MHGSCINRQLDEAGDSPLHTLYTHIFEKERPQPLLDTGGLTCAKIRQSPQNHLNFLFFSNLILKRQKLVVLWMNIELYR